MNDDSASLSENRTSQKATTTPDTIIRKEIKTHGIISFARFMELALYCPDCGFYEKESDSIGRAGNFYTSVSVGSLFGELLAFQFARWIDDMRVGKSDLKIVEAGAHDGRLMADILGWFREHRQDLLQVVKFCIVEPSAKRKEWQQGRAGISAARERTSASGEIAPQVLHWANSLEELGGIEGLVYSNELLDAMPVRRFAWNAQRKEWTEKGVALDNEYFVWAQMPRIEDLSRILQSSGFQLPAELLDVLPDGFTLDVSPATQTWWHEAATKLKKGKLIAFDYGLTADEFLVPERRSGTVRGYLKHHLVDDVLANPGTQDITAHVNFTAMQTAGETAGLQTEMFDTQVRFLTRIIESASHSGLSFSEWTPTRARQFKTLVHPDHLGRAFKVLVQSRNNE